MLTVTVKELNERFETYLELVQSGETIRIVKDGIEIARLQPNEEFQNK